MSHWDEHGLPAQSVDVPPKSIDVRMDPVRVNGTGRADVRVEGCGVLVLLDGWMVVRFVGVTRVPLCARVSCVRPVRVPAPPGIFLP